MARASEYPFVVEILTPTQSTFASLFGWGEFVSGSRVMGKVYPQPAGLSRPSGLFEDDDEGDWDAGIDNDVVSLLEENARLRALVVRLSDLVLKSVVNQK